MMNRKRKGNTLKQDPGNPRSYGSGDTNSREKEHLQNTPQEETLCRRLIEQQTSTVQSSDTEGPGLGDGASLVDKKGT